MKPTPAIAAWSAARPGGDLPGASTSDQASVRIANLALVLSEIFRVGGGLSRADVAARTGLTRATVSRLVKDAIAAGLVVEAPPEDVAKQGRPSIPLYPASHTSVGVGLEVNVDHIAGVAIDLAGEVLAQFYVEGDYADSDPREVLGVLAQSTFVMVQDLRRRGVREIAGVSVAVPGIVERGSGEVIYAPNLGWQDVRPAHYLAEVLPHGTTVLTYNDADLQSVAAAVSLSDQGQELPAFLYISGDTGIGGAIVLDGDILSGERGWAGEIGHMTIDPAGPLCHCGARGCLETFAGWRSIAGAAEMDWSLGVNALIERLELGDVAAHNAVSRAGSALGIAIANAVKLLDIRTVVLGTSLSPLMPWLMASIQAELDQRLLAGDSLDVSVLAPQYDDFPAARGGAFGALQEKLSEPEVRGGTLT